MTDDSRTVYSDVPSDLDREAEKVFHDVAQLSPERWMRMRQPMTWEECTDNRSLQFEVLVLERTKTHIRSSVSVICHELNSIDFHPTHGGYSAVLSRE